MYMKLGSMYYMMFYQWTNDGYEMGRNLNDETFGIYAAIVISGTFNSMGGI